MESALRCHRMAGSTGKFGGHFYRVLFAAPEGQFFGHSQVVKAEFATSMELLPASAHVPPPKRQPPRRPTWPAIPKTAQAGRSFSFEPARPRRLREVPRSPAPGRRT